MTLRRSRTLKADEVELWRSYAAGARPLRPLNEDANVPSGNREEGQTPNPSAAHQGRPFKATVPTAPRKAQDRSQVRNHGLDKKVENRLRRGRLDPEARIDLHGMTREAASRALKRFVVSNHSQGRRLLLVITGKGGARSNSEDPFSSERGVLKRSVPDWLRMPPLAEIVLDTVPAHQRHGGSGALYIYLRRVRN